jgi:hypothetical protein
MGERTVEMRESTVKSAGNIIVVHPEASNGIKMARGAEFHHLWLF